MRQRLRVIAAVAMTLAMTVVGIDAAAADPPSESGVVVRFDDPGFTFLRADTEVGGDVRDLIAVFNFESVADICSQNLAQAASIQLVLAPRSFHQSVTDSDVPVLLFDVTDLGGPPTSVGEFVFLVCVQQSLVPFAWGSADIRVQFNANDVQGTFVDVFSARGSVTDGDSEWQFQARYTNQYDSETDEAILRPTIRLR